MFVLLLEAFFVCLVYVAGSVSMFVCVFFVFALNQDLHENLINMHVDAAFLL